MELTMDQYEAEEAARETPGTGEGEPLPAAPQQPRETPSQLTACSLTSIGQPKVKAPSETKSPPAGTSGLQDTSGGTGNDEAMECLDGPLKRSLPAAHGDEGEPTRLEAADGTAKRTEAPKRLRTTSRTVKEIKNIAKELRKLNSNIMNEWLPGHNIIPGNERAPQAAAEAASSSSSSPGLTSRVETTNDTSIDPD
ncbi:hypothetical protein HPB47_006231 [Ixodes persulcatus]|uniref:Uncharacterized protein n=1 Tax=Ixodes persulcatus TaxID=34615 RepID=A0AC60PB45_IXOPE|nr:hypothetical protein HPB47_006231 [Ixodes persulcatus]